MGELKQNVDASVIKSGETPIEIVLSRRSAVGLQVSAKAFPQIENFMRALGTGAHIPVELSGRQWRTLKGAAPLMAYDLVEKLTTKSYQLDALGQPLDSVQDPRLAYTPPLINLSFLRLVGVSEGAGVSFHLRGVYSTDAERELGVRIQKAATQFFVDYMRPVDIIIKVSTQEVIGKIDAYDI